MHRGRASWQRQSRWLRAAMQARALPAGREAARASSPASRRMPRSRSGLVGVRRLGCLLRRLLGCALLRLLGLTALRLGIRVGDELLAAAPAPGPDHEDQ